MYIPWNSWSYVGVALWWRFGGNVGVALPMGFASGHVGDEGNKYTNVLSDCVEQYLVDQLEWVKT